MEYKKLIEEVVSQSQLSEIPDELLSQTFHIWEGDINPQKDWDDFIGGQLVNHTYYEASFKGGVDSANLEFGSNSNSFYSLFHENTIIEVYTNKFIDLSGKFVTIGGDIDKKFLAVSYRLDNFKLKDKETEVFLGKIVLVDLVKKLSDEEDETSIAPTINIANGKFGETINIPTLKKSVVDEIAETDLTDYEVTTIVVPRVRTIEILLDNPSIIAAPDIVINSDGTVLTDRKVIPKVANTNPKSFPINPFYTIAPVQFNVFSIDNFGFSHPADLSNAAKMLSATQAFASGASTGMSIGGGILGKVANGIGQASVGLSQKFFGDKGTLANSGAITPKFIKSDSDGLKIFIQGDAAGGTREESHLDQYGYLNLKGLEEQKDYMEINQAHGEFGKYGKSMSPSKNGGFNSTEYWRGLGLQNLRRQAASIPALATPFADGNYADLKIDDTKIQDYLKFGSPRLEVYSGDILSPIASPETWPMYVRNMFFRPDPYSFWNWPMLMPSEIGVYNVKRPTSIAYDTEAGINILHAIDTLNDKDNADSTMDSYFSKTITVDQLSNNDLYDPNKTFTSLRYEFEEDDFTAFQIEQDGTKTLLPKIPQILYQLQMFGFTDSIIQVALLDESDVVIRKHAFNSQGRNIGTAASPITVVQF